MRVLITLFSFGLGGTESYTATVAEQLERLGHSVRIHAVHVGPGGAELAAARGLRLTSGDATPVFNQATLPLNAWSHVAATYDGALIRAYLNGVELGNGVAATGTIKNTANANLCLMLGNEPAAGCVGRDGAEAHLPGLGTGAPTPPPAVTATTPPAATAADPTKFDWGP